jgi:hypothetical protein
MIQPTIGRKVWYRPSAADKAGNFGMAQYGDQPLDATIIAVWGDSMVNLHVIDHAGKTFTLTSTKLLQEGDEIPRDADGKDVGRYAYWMPYQVGQAKKHSEPAPLPGPGDQAVS